MPKGKRRAKPSGASSKNRIEALGTSDEDSINDNASVISIQSDSTIHDDAGNFGEEIDDQPSQEDLFEEKLYEAIDGISLKSAQARTNSLLAVGTAFTRRYVPELIVDRRMTLCDGIEPRERDETVLETTETERVEEVQQDVATDEFQNYFEKSYEPKVLITFSDNPLKKTRVFGVELSRIIPNSLVRYRNRASVKKMIESAKRRNFSDIIIVNENMRQPNGLLLIHLPDGPTAHFRLSNVKITTELKKNHKNITTHRPEVIVNNFSTRLGLTIGRMLSSVFHYDPEFKGRRVVTFHNQRDYIFFRHHRYEFKENAKPRLKELGPRFTLRLQSLQKGTFDSKCGEYEWIQTSRRHEIETSRRRFFL